MATTRTPADYQRAHARIRNARGPASSHRCRGYLEPCGVPAAEWAFCPWRPAKVLLAIIECIKDGKTYSTLREFSNDPAAYEPLCARHHKLQDQAYAKFMAELEAA